MIRYLLFAVIGTALFWGLYRLLLHKEHCLRLNRFFLLATLAMSLLIPLIHPIAPVMSYNISGNGYLISLPTSVEATPLPTPSQTVTTSLRPHSPSINQVVGIAYWCGVTLAALILLIRYIATWRKLQRFSFTRKGHYYIAMDENGETPFSFFNYVVISSKGLTEQEADQILTHELAHVRQRHSWDMLMVRLVRCLLWFNPFAWLYERELREVHEYLADENVLHQGDEETFSHYLHLLYLQATGIRFNPLVNSFHFSTIKNRIIMMKQPKSHKGWVKALAALPVAALLLFANCKNQEPAQEQATIPDGTYLVNPFTDTYRDGQLVEREFMGVLLPLEEVNKHKVFADSAEAVRFVEGLGESVKAIINPMVNRDDDQAARWYDVAWSNDPTALCWWNEEDAAERFALAEYPGGVDAMANYIANSVVYPEKAKADGVQGKVYVQFVVETDGSIAEATVLRGVGGECDEEALRVVKAMPQWKPATFKGEPVRSKYVLPIYFMLK